MSNIDMFTTGRPPVIIGGDIACCARGWDWEHVRGRWHPGFNLWLISSGRGSLVSGNDRFDLKAGECFLLRMWTYQHGTHDPDRPLIVPFVLFDFVDDEGTSLTPDRLALPPVRYRVRDVEFMQRLIERTLLAYREHRFDDAARWLSTALEELRETSQPSGTGDLDEEQAARIDALCAQIMHEPGRRYRLDGLARAAHYSRDHLIRVFRKHKGMTPAEFVIRTRIERARTLLSFSRHSIAEIARQLGYADTFCFSHQFKQRIGLSPQAFRQADPGSRDARPVVGNVRQKRSRVSPRKRAARRQRQR